MESLQEAQAKGCNPILTLGGRVSQGTTLTVVAVAVVGTGLVVGWDSLVALGVSTIIIALLPCAVMCALALCAARMGTKDPGAGTVTGAVPPKEARPPAAETVANVEASAVDKTRTSATGAPAP